jgi:Ca2+-transporting ATPase
MEDDFASIVTAIALGRRIFSNLRQALLYTLTIHIPVICLSIMPVLLGLPLILLPIHIAFLELVFDPTCSLVFEAERGSGKEMSMPPRRTTEPLLTVSRLVSHTLLGLAVGGVLTVLYQQLFESGRLLEDVRAIIFTMLVATTIGFVLALRHPRLRLWKALSALPVLSVTVLSVTLLCLVAITSIPMLARMFSMGTLPLTLTGLIALAVVGSVLIMTLVPQYLFRQR